MTCTLTYTSIVIKPKDFLIKETYTESDVTSDKPMKFEHQGKDKDEFYADLSELLEQFLTGISSVKSANGYKWAYRVGRIMEVLEENGKEEETYIDTYNRLANTEEKTILYYTLLDFLAKGDTDEAEMKNKKYMIKVTNMYGYNVTEAYVERIKYQYGYPSSIELSMEPVVFNLYKGSYFDRQISLLAPHTNFADFNFTLTEVNN